MAPSHLNTGRGVPNGKTLHLDTNLRIGVGLILILLFVTMYLYFYIRCGTNITVCFFLFYHRPLVRLSSQKQVSVREMQLEMRRKEKERMSDPENVYRLPGFNNHMPKDSLASSTRFQTPQELESIKRTNSLNEFSTKPMKNRYVEQKAKKFQFSGSSGQDYDTQGVGRSSNSAEVETYVSELLKQVDPALSPSPSVIEESRGPLVKERSVDADVSLFFLEAEGSNEVWIPSGRMPFKRERFATYPAVPPPPHGTHLDVYSLRSFYTAEHEKGRPIA